MTELAANPDVLATFQAATLCVACETAAIKLSGRFEMGCRGCIARGVGRLPQYREAAKLRDSRHRPYVLLLEQAGVIHEEVRAAVARDKEQQLRSDAHSERMLSAHRVRTAAEFKQEAQD